MISRCTHVVPGDNIEERAFSVKEKENSQKLFEILYHGVTILCTYVHASVPLNSAVTDESPNSTIPSPPLATLLKAITFTFW